MRILKFFREEIARVFPGARVRVLGASDSARHVVARVSHEGRTLFAKAAVDPRAGVDAEVEALHAARKLDVPQIVAREPTWFATEAIPGRTKKAWSSEELKRVAVLLAKLHRVRPPKNLRPLPGGSRIEGAIGEGDRAALILLEQKAITQKDALAIQKTIARLGARPKELVELIESTPALCHGDTRAPNVLFTEDGTPHLLDFEHAGRADPAIDLARTAVYERLSKHQFFVLCDAYAESIKDDATIDRAIALEPALALVLALSAARHVTEILAGGLPRADKKKAQTRARDLSERISHLIERPLTLETSPRERSPREPHLTERPRR